MIKEAAHRRGRINVLGVADEINTEGWELLERDDKNAQGPREAVVLPHQDTIENATGRIVHQFAISTVVLVLGFALFHRAANMIDVLLI